MRVGALLVVEPGRWRLGRLKPGRAEWAELAIDSPGGPAAAAGQVARQLAQWRCARRPVCLAISTQQVLWAPIDCANLPRKNQRQAMQYRLEEQLPIDAERLGVDYLPAVGGWALALAVRAGELSAVLAELGKAAVAVQTIVPVSLLALWQLTRQQECDYAVLAGADGLELFRLAQGQSITWDVADTPEGIRRALRADLLARPITGRPPRAIVSGGDAQLLAALSAEAVEARPCEARQDLLSLAADGARELARGRRAGWVNLKRGPLDPRQGQAPIQLARKLAAAVLICAVLLSALLLWRGSRYAGLGADYRVSQEQQFRKFYGRSPMPINIKARLRSELTKLQATSGGLSAQDSSAGAAGPNELPAQPSASETLRLVLASLPPSMRLKIQELRIEPGSLLLAGQIRSLPEAEQLVAALKLSGLLVEPPRTQPLVSGGVSFTIVGKPPEAGQLVARRSSP